MFVEPPTLPLLYRDLAGWFHLLSPPDEYAEEVDVFRPLFLTNSARALGPAADRMTQPGRGTLLDLGAGGGCNAFHLKRDFVCTLADASSDMIAASRRINPECEHVVGDIRTLRLERHFDAVLVHDAIMYMTTEADLRLAIDTAFVHCRPGGIVLFAPDCVSETFRPSTDHGGTDGEDRALRYLAWSWDPDPNDTTSITDCVYVLRERRDEVRVVHDRHVEGLFSRSTWFRLLEGAGFRVHAGPLRGPGIESGELFVAIAP